MKSAHHPCQMPQAPWQRIQPVAALLAFAIGTSACRTDDWPQWMGPGRDNVRRYGTGYPGL